MNERYVIARHCAGGIGDHLSCLIGSWWFAKRTSRKLVVDWRGSRFNPDASMRRNCFFEFFEPAVSLAGVELIAGDDIAGTPFPLPLWPMKWRPENLLDTKHVKHTNEEIAAVNALVTSTIDQPEPTIVFNQWIEPPPPPEAVRSLLSELTLVSSIRNEADEFWHRQIGDAPAIAIHVRHGNGENLGARSAYWLGPFALLRQMVINASSDVHRPGSSGRFFDNMPDSLVGSGWNSELRFCKVIGEEFQKLASRMGIPKAKPVVFSDAPHIVGMIEKVLPTATSRPKKLLEKGGGPLHQISSPDATIALDITKDMFVELDVMRRCVGLLYMDSGFSVLSRSSLPETRMARLRPPAINRAITKIANKMMSARRKT
jgi:Nodulation protein Z (NodZ)